MPNNPNARDNLIPAKKGEIRNPKGKPKGTKHLSTHIQEMLNDESFVIDLKDGNKIEGRPIEAIIKTAIIMAVQKGSVQAMEWLAKHGYGTNITVSRDDPLEALLEEFGVRKAIEDDRKNIESVSGTRKKSA